MTQCNDHKAKELHIAPMMKVSNREFRYFMRLLTKRAVLWTEMSTDEFIYYNRTRSCLDYDQDTEPPIVCQIGGTEPSLTAVAAQVVQEHGYSEINLNMGCPSNRMGGKCSGAILMKDTSRAVRLVTAVLQNVDVPVSVKCRLGVDKYDWDVLVNWMDQLRAAGCMRFFVHSRICMLQGLSPAQNRSIPPLNYPAVYQLCRRFPDCDFWINGGITNLRTAKELVMMQPVSSDTADDQNQNTDPCAPQTTNGPTTEPPHNLRGCMLGRAAMDDPAQFWDVDRYFYNTATNPSQTRRRVLDSYIQNLKQVYPRRCCDHDARKTVCIPAPTVTHTQPHCNVCGGQDTRQASQPKTIHGNASSRCKKIAFGVMERSLMPVRNFFVGLPGHVAFQKICHNLANDLTIRNCGPAFALQQALLVVSEQDLDQKFVPTEDL